MRPSSSTHRSIDPLGGTLREKNVQKPKSENDAGLQREPTTRNRECKKKIHPRRKKSQIGANTGTIIAINRKPRHWTGRARFVSAAPTIYHHH